MQTARSVEALRRAWLGIVKEGFVLSSFSLECIFSCPFSTLVRLYNTGRLRRKRIIDRILRIGQEEVQMQRGFGLLLIGLVVWSAETGGRGVNG